MPRNDSFNGGETNARASMGGRMTVLYNIEEDNATYRQVIVGRYIYTVDIKYEISGCGSALMEQRKGSDQMGGGGRRAGATAAGGEIFEKWKPIRFSKDQRLRPHKRLTEGVFFIYIYRAVFSPTPKNALLRLYNKYALFSITRNIVCKNNSSHNTIYSLRLPRT